jgi:hypothetical protein
MSPQIQKLRDAEFRLVTPQMLAGAFSLGELGSLWAQAVAVGMLSACMFIMFRISLPLRFIEILDLLFF